MDLFLIDDIDGSALLSDNKEKSKQAALSIASLVANSSKVYQIRLETGACVMLVPRLIFRFMSSVIPIETKTSSGYDIWQRKADLILQKVSNDLLTRKIQFRDNSFYIMEKSVYKTIYGAYKHAINEDVPIPCALSSVLVGFDVDGHEIHSDVVEYNVESDTGFWIDPNNPKCWTRI